VRDLSEVAAQIRSVREARQKFLRLWAMEQSVIHPALDRMADDVEAASGGERPTTMIRFNDSAARDDKDQRTNEPG
jgi:hypothetical protein